MDIACESLCVDLVIASSKRTTVPSILVSLGDYFHHFRRKNRLIFQKIARRLAFISLNLKQNGNIFVPSF